MFEKNQQVWGIILAGGEGKRLQPFIRSEYGIDAPKQYCAFTGTRSMLRHTIDRAELLIQPEQLLTIVSKQHRQYSEDQLADRPPGTVIMQSFNRETGAAVLYPLLHIYMRDPEAIVCLFPSDHFVLNEINFMKHIDRSTKFVTTNPHSTILLGIDPKHSESDYGWIVIGEPIADDNINGVYQVSQFVEKPDMDTASQLYRKGSLWNTMVIVSKAKTLLESFKNLTPTVYQAFWEIRDVLGSSRESHIVEKVYLEIPPINFSYSILEKKSVGLYTVKVQGVNWSDWGTASRVQHDILHFCNSGKNHVRPLSVKKINVRVPVSRYPVPHSVVSQP